MSKHKNIKNSINSNFLSNDDYKSIKNIFSKITDKKEFEIMFFNYKNDSDNKMILENYIDVCNYMKNRKQLDNKLEFKISTTLDIIYSSYEEKTSYRITINDINKINEIMESLHLRKNHVIYSLLLKKYKKKENHIEMIKKKRDFKNIIDIDDYNIRVRMLDELKPDESDFKKLEKIDFKQRNQIIFRYKQRISLILVDNKDVTIRLDVSNVKMNNNINFIEKTNSQYEMELELLSNSKGKVNEKYLETILFESKQLLKLLQKSNYIISNTDQKAVLDRYRYLYGLESKTNNFIGTNVVSLEIQHVLNFLPNNYNVTDKADGDRFFLIIFNRKVYLISTNLEVKYTGIELDKKLEKYNDVLLDGEYIFLKEKNKYIFMVFDCLTKNSKSNCFEEEDIQKRLDNMNKVIYDCFGDKNTYKFNNIVTGDINKYLNFHSDELDKYLNQLNKDIDESKDLLIRSKYFIPVLGVQDNEIYKYSKLLWNKYIYNNKITVPYDLDGLIYSPLNQRHHIASKEYKFNYYKFKPPNKNSIDFFIRFEKDPSTKEILKVYDNTIDLQSKCYAVCNLYNGKFINNKEVPILFKKESNKHLAYLFFDNGLIKDIEGNIIKDNTVVEFYYDLNPNIKNDKFRWVPMKTRYDKTQSVIRFKKKYGNYFSVANRVWRSIINPFTIDDINNLSIDDNFKSYSNKLKLKIKDDSTIIKEKDSDDKNKYYQLKTNIGREQRRFHNWIKESLISTYFKSIDNKKINVLDIGVGRGGDIQKYMRANVNLVVGIDPDYSNLNSKGDGAKSRFEELKKKDRKNKTKMDFIQASGNLELDYEHQQVEFSNMDQENKNLINKYFSNNDKNRFIFNRINLQFSVHYFLKDKYTWSNFCTNINNYLEDDGIVLMTCFDGDMISKKLDNNNLYSVKYTDNEGFEKEFFEIKKNYTKLDKNQLGNSIDVKISSFSDKFITEYLVFKDFFVDSLLNNCNLELIDTNLFTNVYDNNKDFFKNYIKYESEKGVLRYLNNVSNYFKDMNSEKEASLKLTELNRYYIFRKNNNLKKKVNSKNKTKNKMTGGELDILNKKIKKILGKKMFFENNINSENSNYSYQNILYDLAVKNKYVEQSTNINEFYSNLGLEIVKDIDIEDNIIKNINSRYKIGKKIKGINVILLEKKSDGEIYINSYGKKKKMLRTNPTVLILKNENKYFKINKEKKDKSIDIFKTDSTFINKLIDKYELK